MDPAKPAALIDSLPPGNLQRIDLDNGMFLKPIQNGREYGVMLTETAPVCACKPEAAAGIIEKLKGVQIEGSNLREKVQHARFILGLPIEPFPRHRR